MKRVLIIFAIFLGVQFGLKAQPATLYYMTNLRQTIYTNPARMSDCSFSFAFPGLTLYSSLYSNPLNYSDIFSLNNSNGRFYIDFRKIASSLGQNNGTLLNENRISILNFGIRYRQWYFNFDYSVRNQNYFEYPKGLFDFLAYGNTGKYANVDLSGINLNTLLYTQKSFTVAYRPLRNLKIGVSLKLNHGLMNIQTNSFNVSAKFDTTETNNYPVTLVGDYNLNMAGPVRPVLYNNKLAIVPTSSPVNDSGKVSVDSVMHMINSMKNSGLAMDLGIVYSPIKYVELSASIIDLGYIKWRTNATNLMAALDSVTFDGTDLLDSTKTQAIIDTIEQQLSPKLTYAPYKTSLYAKFNFGIALKPVYYLTLGFNYRATKLPSSWYNVYTLGAYLNPGYGWSFAMNYSWYPNSRKNIGMGMAFNLFGAQLYFMMDNISLPNFGISYFTNRNTPYTENSATNWVKQTQLINFMFGLNFHFGCYDRTDYGMLD